MASRFVFVVASGFVLVSAVAAFARSSTSEEFLSKAMQGDASEIKLGQLAERNAGSAAVRNFGKTLVVDHSKAEQQVKATAGSLGYQPPEQPAGEAQQEYDKLQALSGSAFDREFVDYMVKDHQKDIAAFRKEAQAKDGPTSALAKKQLPVLEKHLKLAQSLQSKQGS